jgi:hypothetical protein
MIDDNDPDLTPEPHPLTPEERAALMAKLKAQFSSQDLQRFTEEDEGIPMEQVLDEMKRVYQEAVKRNG